MVDGDADIEMEIVNKRCIAQGNIDIKSLDSEILLLLHWNLEEEADNR